jgi:hypothetical protein
LFGAKKIRNIRRNVQSPAASAWGILVVALPILVYTAGVMRDKQYEKSKRYVVCGLIGLALGSVLLLARKLSVVPEFWADLSVFAGGCILLGGNTCIVYGLLIFVGHQGTE